MIFVNNMKVSILVTTYNIEKYVDDAIKSIVQQNMPFDWELLIGDDGSSDGTADKIRKWIEKYPGKISLFVHERTETKIKTGSRAAKNRAFLLERAKGEYIHFLDGDDCFIGLDTIKKQVQILEDPQYFNCSSCAQNMLEYHIPTGQKHLLIKEGGGDKVYDINQYWSKLYFSTDTILFRRECLELMLHPLYRDYLNDNFITFLILQYGKVYYQDIVGAQYNQTGEGLWTGHSMVYGAFRNLQLYDLEIHVRKDMRRLCLNKHKNDIRKIRKMYKPEMMKEVKPLMDGLDPKIFKASTLLFKLTNLSFAEWFRKKALFLRADLLHLQFLSIVATWKMLGFVGIKKKD